MLGRTLDGIEVVSTCMCHPGVGVGVSVSVSVSVNVCVCVCVCVCARVCRVSVHAYDYLFVSR